MLKHLLRETFYSCRSLGEGTLTVIKEVTKGKFVVDANVPTKRGARLSNDTHRIFADCRFENTGCDTKTTTNDTMEL